MARRKRAKPKSKYTQYRNRLLNYVRRQRREGIDIDPDALRLSVNGRDIYLTSQESTERNIRASGIKGSALTKLTNQIKKLVANERNLPATSKLSESDAITVADLRKHIQKRKQEAKAAQPVPSAGSLAYRNAFSDFERRLNTPLTEDQTTNAAASGRNVHVYEFARETQETARGVLADIIDQLGGGEIGRAAIGKRIIEDGERWHLQEALDDMLFGSSVSRVAAGWGTVSSFLSTVKPLSASESAAFEDLSEMDDFTVDLEW